MQENAVFNRQLREGLLALVVLLENLIHAAREIVETPGDQHIEQPDVIAARDVAEAVVLQRRTRDPNGANTGGHFPEAFRQYKFVHAVLVLAVDQGDSPVLQAHIGRHRYRTQGLEPLGVRWIGRHVDQLPVLERRQQAWALHVDVGIVDGIRPEFGHGALHHLLQQGL
ncbi:hypothetical protein ASD07_06100 [Duganella sp. Root336D2]|nr:hypothetical protein ASD07_06100 [Duganella sp. Root336D2]